MTRKPRLILALIVLAVAAPRGQGRQAAGPVRLEPPLDESVEDRNVLSRSLRLVDPGLSMPDDFDQVYRVPGHPDQLMRVQGSVYAVFPYSVYKRDKKGNRFADIPAGTIFHIGGPPDPIAELPAAGLFADRLETRLPPQPAGRMRFNAQAQIPSAAPAAPALAPTVGPASFGTGPHAEPVLLPAIVADADYRARRLRELADLAAAARRAVPQAALGRSPSSSK